jgi:O-antigen ligase
VNGGEAAALRRPGSPVAASLAGVLLGVGGVAVVLAAAPFKAFELDRFFVPKELVLHVTAMLASLALVGRVRRLELTRVDMLLLLYLGLSVVSALLASNWWLAGRAFAISLSGAAVFWAARVAARVGRGGLLSALALAVVVAAVTSLLQAYGVTSEYVSLNRAPGGTLGNRNFVAHLAAIGTPVLLLRTLGARRRLGAGLGGVGLALVSAALVLSRSRAAWLALLVCGAIVAFTVLAGWRTWRAARLGGRVRLVGASVALGVAAVLLLPNTLNWRSDSPYLDSIRGVVNYREGSGRGRLIQYRTSLRMAAGHPVLGVGPGNWPVHYPAYATPGDPSLDRDDGMTANPWPSSDWVAVVAERGAVAAASLVLVFVGLGVGALGAMVRARTAEQLMPPVALLATLVVIAVVGAFDAVLLLAAPSLIGWALLGALAVPAKARRVVVLHGRRRAWLVLGVLAAGGLAVGRSGLELAAMAAFEPGGRLAVLERAARLDPGSYRLRIELAEAYVRRQRCDRARPEAQRARSLFPHAPEPRRLLRMCAVRRVRGAAGR